MISMERTSEEEDEIGNVPNRQIKRKAGGDQHEQTQEMSELTLSEKQLIWYPCTLGQTGFVFKNDTYIVQNDAKKKFISLTLEKDQSQHVVEYMSDVDNCIGVKKIENYMIGVLRGGDFNKPNGVVQMMNYNGHIGKT